MYTTAHRFGDTRSRQSKIQKKRTSNPGSGIRRRDPQIHATSRPWHTSTPGIRMNVSTLGQIAGTHPVRNKYLNRMKLSEMAQKKRGLAEEEEGRGIDKMGRAIKRGTEYSDRLRRAYGAPNQETIDRMQAEITGRAAALEREKPTTDPHSPEDEETYRKGKEVATGRIAAAEAEHAIAIDPGEKEFVGKHHYTAVAKHEKKIKTWKGQHTLHEADVSKHSKTLNDLEMEMNQHKKNMGKASIRHTNATRDMPDVTIPQKKNKAAILKKWDTFHKKHKKALATKQTAHTKVDKALYNSREEVKQLRHDISSAEASIPGIYKDVAKEGWKAKSKAGGKKSIGEELEQAKEAYGISHRMWLKEREKKRVHTMYARQVAVISSMRKEGHKNKGDYLHHKYVFP